MLPEQREMERTHARVEAKVGAGVALPDDEDEDEHEHEDEDAGQEDDGSSYEGATDEAGLPHGHGTQTTSTNEGPLVCVAAIPHWAHTHLTTHHYHNRYVGHFEEGLQCGSGLMTFPDGYLI